MTQRLELPQSDRALLDRPEIKCVAFANADMAFTLPSAPCRTFIELENLLIESGDLLFARELPAGRRWPHAIIPPGENQM